MRLPLWTIMVLVCCWSTGVHGDLSLVSIDNGKILQSQGDLSGTWRTKSGRMRVSVNREKDETFSLKLDYNVSVPRTDAGQWFAFNHFDMRPYEAVRLKVRGLNGGEMMAFGLKDDRWFEERISLEKYLNGPITKEWQTVTIPLKDFVKVRQWDSMDNFSISVFHTEGFLPRSLIFVKDIELVKGEKPLTVRVPEKEVFSIPFDTDHATDDQLLDLVQRSAFGFFWNEANPENGLIKDRCFAFGPDQRRVSSIASVGFGLTAICVADKRGWITREEAYERVINTLNFFDVQAVNYNGFYYHYYEMDTGAPLNGCEISSIDTAILLAGVLTVKQYFKGTDIEPVAQRLLDKTDWQWMTDGKKYLSMGWYPGNQFIPHQWRDYNESLLLYFLATGAPKDGIPGSTWNLVERETFKYAGQDFVPASGENCLFEHQYPQVWINMKGRKDARGIDYFDNSRRATLASYEWSMANKDKYKTFAQGFWGLTACDGPTGYVVNGAPYGQCDGTVAPTGPIGSLPFTPELSMEQIRKYFTLENRIWGKYGLVDSFNLEKNWFSSVYLGIDQGPIVLMIENHRTGMIWDLVSQTPEIQTAFTNMEFKSESAAAAEVRANPEPAVIPAQ